ncbi:MAG TPA: hypothetical protein PK046_03250 [Candidatus Syntrophosphaera sp.]|nr:hypothetical protein [Candidatus Syntrophosphaera sp.]
MSTVAMIKTVIFPHLVSISGWYETIVAASLQANQCNFRSSLAVFRGRQNSHGKQISSHISTDAYIVQQKQSERRESCEYCQIQRARVNILKHHLVCALLDYAEKRKDCYHALSACEHRARTPPG